MTRKQTSDRVSRLAAKWLQILDGIKYKGARELRAICASALSQDEVKGKRKKRRAA